MEKRVIDLSEESVSLSVRYNQLVLRRGDKENTVPLEELGVLIVSHPAVHYTHAVLTGLCDFGGIFILCNDKRIPSAMLLPLEANATQTERLAAQTAVPIPTKKRLWQQVIKAKVMAQAQLLKELCGNDLGLAGLSKKVRSGDSGNIEGQASRRYWTGLFGIDSPDKAGDVFRRLPGDETSPNCLLNYGYAILRGIVARAVCAAGLHPSFGLHHHNRYNAFCLADDLMEPFRPLIDEAVIRLVCERGPAPPLDKISKTILIESLINRRYNLEGDSRTLFEVALRTASSLAAVYAGKRKRLLLPE